MASSLPTSNLSIHERFHFSDGSLRLSVENSLYCVHRYLFETHATKFPVHEIGTSGSEPYILEGVTRVDFDRLLAFLYPRTLWEEEAETTEEWTSILKLASKWGFQSLRLRAISRIEQTLESPVDMVTLGRHYDIPDILLAGYATLCQSNLPLSYEEGRRLGMKDVVNIYRIRHELYGSDIILVGFNEALEKVWVFMAIEGKEDDAEDPKGKRRDPDHPGLEDEETTEWTDAGSVLTSQTSPTEGDKETVTSAVDTPTSRNMSGAQTGPAPEQEQTEVHTDVLTSEAASLASSPGTERLEINPSLSRKKARKQGVQFLTGLTTTNFIQVTDKILQLLEDNPYSHTLSVMTRVIVNKSVISRQSDILIRLCNKLAGYTTGKIKDKKMKSNGKYITGGRLFCEYLGNICRESLERVAKSVTVSVDDSAELQRLRLIEFIRELAKLKNVEIWTPDIIEKWVTALLDPDDEEKVVTFCMLMKHVGPLCDNEKKHRAHMQNWFQRIISISEKTEKPRVRTVLQDVISFRERGWVAT